MNENPTSAQVTAPAGWYPDPHGYNGQRYWDGRAWTPNIAPLAPVQAKSEAKTGDWIGGVLLSLLMPLIGAIAGAVYIAKGGTKAHVGIMCLCLSAVTFLFWVAAAGGGA